MTFGEKLRDLLDEKDIMQKELARMLNIAPSTVNSYITDSHLPNIETIRRIAELLEVSTDYLLDFGDSPKPFSAKEFEMIRKFRSLARNDRNAVIYLVDRLAGKNG